jgi:hypothetical protein
MKEIMEGKENEEWGQEGRINGRKEKGGKQREKEDKLSHIHVLQHLLWSTHYSYYW